MMGWDGMIGMILMSLSTKRQSFGTGFVFPVHSKNDMRPYLIQMIWYQKCTALGNRKILWVFSSI